MRALLALLLALACARIGAAQTPLPQEQTPAPRPVLVEMFVSQSCSSCLPADALLEKLAAKDKGAILPLSYDVNYWNDTGWRDTDSSAGATSRQFWYAKLASSQDVYTPEAVVDGTVRLVGSDRLALVRAIDDAANDQGLNVQLGISGDKMLTLALGPAVAPGQRRGTVVLIGYDPRHVTHVLGGENAGKTITEVNVVRSVTALGAWLGMDEHFTVPRPAGAHMALVLQGPKGAVLGLAAQ